MGEIKTAFDKISAGLRDAIAGNFERICIDGATWVRADAGSPDEDLMLCRQHIAELTEKIDALTSEHHGLREKVKTWIDMTVNCAGVPQNPDSLPQMLLHEFRASLSKQEEPGA